MTLRPVVIEPTSETPKVVLDKEAGVFEISGNSLPEDVMSFYDPILGWLEDYAAMPNERTEVILNLQYYNTSSSKMILRILETLRDMHRKGHRVEVHWHFMEDDEDMIEAGEDFSENIKIPFKFVRQTR